MTGASLVFLGLAEPAHAYSLSGSKWTASSITLQLQLGPSSGTLLDGSASWGAAAEDALNRWNLQIANTRFNVVRDSTATRAGGNRLNNVFFSANVYGDAFGSGVLAVTVTYSSGGTTAEADVIFNNALNWNSYRGPLRFTSTGAAIYDFHRVALHEFGHALGLNHPDDAGQNVVALMNSRIGSLDSLAADDITGAQFLYGATGFVAPPVITTDPSSRTVTVGQSTTFSVAASSTAPITYQWQKTGVAIAGASAANYTIVSATLADAGTYTAVVTNSGGSVTSAGAILTVNPSGGGVTPPPPPPPAAVAPTISSAPASQTVAVGGTASFSVVANGTAPLVYQWRRNGVALASGTGATLTLSNVQLAEAGSYQVVITNSAGSATSVPVTLTVTAPPVILSQPVGQAVLPGSRVILSVAATGSGPLSYQWRKDGVALAGATQNTLTLDSVQAPQVGDYTVVVTGNAGAVTSAVARVALVTTPTIAAAPQDQAVDAGAPLRLSVSPGGAGPFTYQWFKDGSEIAGATESTFFRDAARPADGGVYTVRITNTVGSTTSAPARVTINFSRLVNLSTRGFVPAGGTLTPGFFIRGSGSKPLVVRAVGPTLSLFGVAEALRQTTLAILVQDSAAVVATNSAWGGSTTLGAAFNNVGAFPLPPDSNDSAVLATLTPRGYTVRIEPAANGLAGIALAEVYDHDAATAGTQLVNLSTLGFVGVGEQALSAGFVISGNRPKRLLVRAIGPGLDVFGVSGRLPNPQLGVIAQGASEPVASNDDWADSADLRNAFTAAGAFQLTPGSRDAALVVTLNPGGYTVNVSDVSGQLTGTALVEIYDLDP